MHQRHERCSLRIENISQHILKVFVFKTVVLRLSEIWNITYVNKSLCFIAKRFTEDPESPSFLNC